jgi:hypothetical protein
MDHTPDIAVLKQRADQADVRMGRMEDKLDQIAAAVSALGTQIASMNASLPTKDTIRGWGLGLLAAIVGSVLALGALLVAMQANTLSAFQAGLSTVQGVVAARPAEPGAPPAPVVIQLPALPAPQAPAAAAPPPPPPN